MSWSKRNRQIHRRVSIAFTLAVIVTFLAGLMEQPPEWIYYIALPPLFLLLLTGLYLFALPYLGKRRGGRSTA